MPRSRPRRSRTASRRWATPVAWLLDNASVDARWCLIHATHMTDGRDAAARGVRRGGRLVPAHRGLARRRHFPRRGVFRERRRFGVGTNSNILIGAAAELRMLEYSQRLRRHTRNVFAQEGESTGTRIYREAWGRRAGAGARHWRDRGRQARRHRRAGCRAPRCDGRRGASMRMCSWRVKRW